MHHEPPTDQEILLLLSGKFFEATESYKARTRTSLLEATLILELWEKENHKIS